MKIIKSIWINETTLNETEKECFKRHYKENENIYILTENGNVEYKILDYKENKYLIEFTGKVII